MKILYLAVLVLVAGCNDLPKQFEGGVFYTTTPTEEKDIETK